jgi:sec-independent protein translocase protein TatA
MFGPGFGWPEALIILTVILIVFGVGKLPQVGGALGKGLREFRRGRAGLIEEIEEKEEEEAETPKGKKAAEKLPEGKTKSKQS